MPFFGGGGSGDYHINGTNITGGNGAMPAVIGDNNMALGNGAMQSALNADRNIAIGNGALSLTDDAVDTIAIGHLSFNLTQTVEQSIAIGSRAGEDGPIYGSVIIGHESAPAVTLMSDSVAIGAFSLGTPSGVYTRSQTSVAIGTGAGYTSAPSQLTGSVLIGSGAGTGLGSINGSCVNSVFIGDNCGTTSVRQRFYDCVGIGANTFIGDGTGTITTGATVIGANSSPSPSGTDISGSIALGQNIAITGINQIIIGDEGLTWTKVVVGGVDLLNLPGKGAEYSFATGYVRAISGTGSFSAFGVSNTVIGTPSTLLFSNSSVVTANPNVYLSSAATAGASCGVSSANAACITPGSFGNGGFEFAAEFAINDSTGSVGNNGRFFVGLSGDGTAPNSNPSSWTTALAGIGSDAGDAEASIFYNVFFGTAVKIPLGVDFPIAAFGVPALWSVSLAWKPGDTVIKCAVKRKTNTATFTHNEDIPLIDSGFALFAHVWRNNAAVAAAVRLAVSGYSVKNYVGWDSPT